MSAALVILVLVAAGERSDASTRSVGPALEQAARRSVTVAVREGDVQLDELQVARAAADGKADVVVDLGWRSPRHEHATVHLHARDGQQLRASELDFGDTSPRGERGRAVGFAIATMLDEEPVAASILAATAPSAAASAAPEAPRPAPAPATATATAPAPAPAFVTSSRPVAAALRSPDRAETRAATAPRFAVEGAGSAMSDVRGDAVGGGPLLRLQWNASEDVGLRVGGGAKWFTLGGRTASELGANVGVLWTFARGRSLAAAVRAEVGVLRDSFTEAVARTNPRGMALPSEAVDRAGIAPSILGGLEGDWRPSRSFALYLALDLAASTRTVTASASAPSPVWAGSEGGVRISF